MTPHDSMRSRARLPHEFVGQQITPKPVATAVAGMDSSPPAGPGDGLELPPPCLEELPPPCLESLPVEVMIIILRACSLHTRWRAARCSSTLRSLAKSSSLWMADQILLDDGAVPGALVNTLMMVPATVRALGLVQPRCGRKEAFLESRASTCEKMRLTPVDHLFPPDALAGAETYSELMESEVYAAVADASSAREAVRAVLEACSPCMALEVYVTGSEEDDRMEDVDWISLLIKAKSPNLTSLVDNAYCLEWHFPSESASRHPDPRTAKFETLFGVRLRRVPSAARECLQYDPGNLSFALLSVLGHTAINACILASIWLGADIAECESDGLVDRVFANGRGMQEAAQDVFWVPMFARYWLRKIGRELADSLMAGSDELQYRELLEEMERVQDPSARAARDLRDSRAGAWADITRRYVDAYCAWLGAIFVDASGDLNSVWDALRPDLQAHLAHVELAKKQLGDGEV